MTGGNDSVCEIPPCCAQNATSCLMSEELFLRNRSYPSVIAAPSACSCDRVEHSLHLVTDVKPLKQRRVHVNTWRGEGLTWGGGHRDIRALRTHRDPAGNMTLQYAKYDLFRSIQSPAEDLG